MGLKMLWVLLGVLLWMGEVSAECGQPQFKEDANNRVQANFKTIRRRGKVSFDYRTIEVVYYPFQMVEDASCLDEAQLNLEVKAGEHGTWTAMESVPTALGGGKYKWSIPAVPCLDHHIKLWVTGPGGQASLEYAQPIKAASTEEIIAAKFTPEKPEGLTVTNMEASGEVRVTWTASECATSYDLSYGRNLDSMQSQIVSDTEIVLSELEPCTDYDISIFAVVGEEEYSIDEASTRFTTPPDTASAMSLEPVVDTQTNAMMARWRAYDRLSCVTKYAVSVCKEQEADCTDSAEVERSDALDYISYHVDGLDHCSPYTLHIQPLYSEKNLDPKIVDFRTLSPSAEGISEHLLPVTAETGEGQKIFVSWSPVQCAEYYEVFQKVNQDDGDWEVVHRTDNTSAELNGVPCTEYRYGVQATIDGVKSQIMEVPNTVVTELDDTASFIAPNLEVNPLEDGAIFTWDHGACISNYVVKVCHTDVGGDLICEQDDIMRDPSVHNITHTVHNLKPCHAYYLEILPEITGKEFEPNHIEFKTAFPLAAPPSEFSAVYKQGSNRVELEWSEVECASGYKIMQKIGNSDTTTAWETNNPRLLFTSLDSPEPCVTYSYGVAAVVGLEDSEPTSMEIISIPPRQGSSHQPKLNIVENHNDTVHLTINPAPTNTKCQVEVYEVRYSSLKHEEVEQREIAPEALDTNGQIVLSFPGASGPVLNLEGRIKYDGFDTYSPWIKSKELAIQTHEQLSGGNMLVPVIIGILVGVVILVIIIFFVVKRKRTQSKYDAEKAANNKDETQKLNEHAEA